MQYLSTRGYATSSDSTVSFSDILLGGLAPDGGLFLPKHYPQVTAEELNQWRSLSYAELAYEILRKFATDIPDADLREGKRKNKNRNRKDKKQKPLIRRESGAMRNKSLTMTYFHTGCSTIIGAKSFHGPVRDGKVWYQLAIVIRHNLLIRCFHVEL